MRLIEGKRRRQREPGKKSRLWEEGEAGQGAWGWFAAACFGIRGRRGACQCAGQKFGWLRASQRGSLGFGGWAFDFGWAGHRQGQPAKSRLDLFRPGFDRSWSKPNKGHSTGELKRPNICNTRTSRATLPMHISHAIILVRINNSLLTQFRWSSRIHALTSPVLAIRSGTVDRDTISPSSHRPLSCIAYASTD